MITDAKIRSIFETSKVFPKNPFEFIFVRHDSAKQASLMALAVPDVVSVCQRTIKSFSLRFAEKENEEYHPEHNIDDAEGNGKPGG